MNHANRYQNVPFWILLEPKMMEVVVATTGAIRRAKLQSNRHHQQTNTEDFFTCWMPFQSPNQQCHSTPLTEKKRLLLWRRNIEQNLPSFRCKFRTTCMVCINFFLNHWRKMHFFFNDHCLERDRISGATGTLNRSQSSSTKVDRYIFTDISL